MPTPFKAPYKQRQRAARLAQAISRAGTPLYPTKAWPVMSSPSDISRQVRRPYSRKIDGAFKP